MFVRFSPLALAASLFLGGCSALQPMNYKPDAPYTPEAAAEAASTAASWNEPAVMTEGLASVVLLTPMALPADVASRPLSIKLEPGATVQDIVAILGKLGLPVILSDGDTGGKKLFLPHYKGTVGGLLSAVTRATDVWFTWHDGTIVVASKERIGLSLPQEARFAEQLSKGLEAMGVSGKEQGVSWHAGMAVLEISPSQFRHVRTFLERLTANAAVVNLQMAVVNVAMNQTANQGIDWEKLNLSVVRGGTLADLGQWRNAVSNPNSGLPGTSQPVTGGNGTYNNGTGTWNNGTTGNTGTGNTGTGNTGNGTTGQQADLGKLGSGLNALSLAGGALQGAIFRQSFSFTGLFNYLQTYGNAETKQNVMLKTVAGQKVEFKSLTQIPYVSEIGATTTSGVGNNNVVGSSRTEKADDGITVEMTPLFDAAANTVTVELKLSIKAVVAFNELSAGNQLGKMTQPTTADRSFTDSVRLRPGHTAVLGGLTYDSVSDNRGAPIFLSGTRMESQSLKVQRQTMFIVLRPTVTKLGRVLLAETGADEPLNFLPQSNATLPPDDEPETPRGKHKSGGNS